MNENQEKNLTWKLNWYRQSELEGALLLGRIVGMVRDPHLIRQLTAHCADEARHSQIWAETIERCGLPTVAIRRSYQSFYVPHGGIPASVVEVLAFTQIFEQRVHRRFHQELKDPSLPEVVRQAFEVMIEDEHGHLDWVAQWLRSRLEAPELLNHYRRIDEVVFRELAPFEDSIWKIPGLGVAPVETMSPAEAS